MTRDPFRAPNSLVEEVDGAILPTPEMVELLHSIQLRRFGGGQGIRDRGLLQSAVARGAASLQWSEAPDTIDAACGMGEGVIRNHPFVDGNKRTGFAVILSTLTTNACRFDMDPIEAARLIVDFAASRVSSEEFRKVIRDHVQVCRTGAEIEALSERETPAP